MSIQVKVFDEKKAKEILKTCPKIVRDYYKLLNDSLNRQKDLTEKAIQKLHETSSKPKEEQPEKIVRELPTKEIMKDWCRVNDGFNNTVDFRTLEILDRLLSIAQPIITRQSKEIEELKQKISDMYAQQYGDADWVQKGIDSEKIIEELKSEVEKAKELLKNAVNLLSEKLDEYPLSFGNKEYLLIESLKQKV
jgi:hypothetical protein